MRQEVPSGQISCLMLFLALGTLGTVPGSKQTLTVHESRGYSGKGSFSLLHFPDLIQFTSNLLLPTFSSHATPSSYFISFLQGFQKRRLLQCI